MHLHFGLGAVLVLASPDGRQLTLVWELDTEAYMGPLVFGVKGGLVDLNSCMDTRYGESGGSLVHKNIIIAHEVLLKSRKSTRVTIECVLYFASFVIQSSRLLRLSPNFNRHL